MSESVIHATRRLYGIDRWGDSYFDIGASGTVEVRPGSDTGVAIPQLVAHAREAGMTLPVLFRFKGILRHRLDRICAAFADAVARHDYGQRYRLVYPIKVNQQHSVVDTLVSHGGNRVGLEAGSKPELMAVLGISPASGLIVCNGYKDDEYLRLALAATALGQELYVVIEKPSELDRVLELASEMGVEPRLGLRLRLASLGTGKWRDSGGGKSKFGLTAEQLLEAADKLVSSGRNGWARLLHIHLGSQVTNLRDIRRGITEAARILVGLREQGLPLDHMDVGGGLGVDYEGTRSRNVCSVNYSVEEYADGVVGTLAEILRQSGSEPPELLSESGRALTAQHAVLVTNVTGVDAFDVPVVDLAEASSTAELAGLQAQLEEFDHRAADEVYREALHRLEEIQESFSAGRLRLADRAGAERIARAVMVEARKRLESSGRSRDVLDELKAMTADKMFINLSIFQSLPDIWAIDQLFPIIPVQRLDEMPDSRAILQDLTCDSDGRVDRYIDGEGVEHSLPVHRPDGREYLLGFFMVGAYQEILGDLHNLFGDTDSVDVDLAEDSGLLLGPPSKGDTAAQLLAYVKFAPEKLRDSYADKVSRSDLSAEQRSEFLRLLSDGLDGYTYLE